MYFQYRPEGALIAPLRFGWPFLVDPHDDPAINGIAFSASSYRRPNSFSMSARASFT
jgi:hypothetical protein